MPNWKKVIVSGSDASLNSLSVTTNVQASSFTGSLFGTASWAINVVNGGGGSTNVSTYLSSSWTGSNSSQFSGTSSYAFSASYALSGGSGGSTFPYTGTAQIIGALEVTGPTTLTGDLGVTGTVTITGLQNCADDTAAAFAGVPINGVYRNGNFLLIRLT